MQRLIKDAAALDSSIDANSMSFANIVKAINVVQTKMGITGTTAKEAGRTIEGSVNAMKSAWTNLLTGLADGNADIETLVEDLVTTIVGDGTENNLGVLGNIMPAVKMALKGAAKVVAQSAPIIAEELPKLMEEILPDLASATANLIVALAEQIPSMASTLIDAAYQIVDEIGNAFAEKIPGLSWVFENLETVIIGVATALATLKVTMAMSALIDGLTKAWQAYKTANEGATVAQWLLNAAQNANPMMLVISLVAGLVAAIVTLWNTNEGFRNALISAWEAIKSAANTIFSAVANFFTETIPNAFNSVIDWFKNIGKKFSDIGKNIIDGIKSGIKNAWNNLVSWFKGLFGDLIGIAKKILGIASPSKVFKKIGGFTAEGFGVGFEDEFAHVKDDMEDALNFDDASVGINASIRKVGAGAAGMACGGVSYGDINIYVNGDKYHDENALAEALAMKLQGMTDRRAAVFGNA